MSNMAYPFPTTVSEPANLQLALEIAMNYFSRRGIPAPFSATQHTCAYVILREWRTGNRHPLWMANAAIQAVEKAVGPFPAEAPEVREPIPPGPNGDFYPRALLVIPPSK
jgi:hypothetical protein